MPTSAPDPHPQNVLTQLSGILVACPGCGKSFTPRRPNHRYCSTTCRVVWFQQKEIRERRERDAKVRLLLGTVLTTHDPAIVRQRTVEALELLKPEKDGIS